MPPKTYGQTSAVDPQTELRATRALEKLLDGRTSVTIAHRLSTLQHCDRIYRLERGRVVAVSSYAEAVAGAHIIRQSLA